MSDEEPAPVPIDVYKGRLRITSNGFRGDTRVVTESGEELPVTRIDWRMGGGQLAETEIHVLLSKLDVVVIDPVIRIVRPSWKSHLPGGGFDTEMLRESGDGEYLQNKIRWLEGIIVSQKQELEAAVARGWDHVGSHACPDMKAHTEAS